MSDEDLCLELFETTMGSPEFPADGAIDGAGLFRLFKAGYDAGIMRTRVELRPANGGLPGSDDYKWPLGGMVQFFKREVLQNRHCLREFIRERLAHLEGKLMTELQKEFGPQPPRGT